MPVNKNINSWNIYNYSYPLLFYYTKEIAVAVFQFFPENMGIEYCK